MTFANEEKEILYAVVTERRRTWLSPWEPENISYIHALNQPNAKFKYLSSRTPQDLNGGLFRLVCVAPAIGAWVEDKEGNVLSL